MALCAVSECFSEWLLCVNGFYVLWVVQWTTCLQRIASLYVQTRHYASFLCSYQKIELSCSHTLYRFTKVPNIRVRSPHKREVHLNTREILFSMFSTEEIKKSCYHIVTIYWNMWPKLAPDVKEKSPLQHIRERRSPSQQHTLDRSSPAHDTWVIITP